MTLGRLTIGETEIPTKKRSGALPKLCAALKEIFITPEWNEKIFQILEAKITKGKKRTGRPGMDLWQIFVLAQVRLCQNISYDEGRRQSIFFGRQRQGATDKTNCMQLSDKSTVTRKGKCNKMEQAEEDHRSFKLLRNRHSAVESNINELECRGLDRCPDRGYPNFKRYTGLAVAAYNLRRIGQELIEAQRHSLQSADKELNKAA